ncbi:hypothetical protein BBH88_12085 [Planococcus antarcticus DSM 14505]|uniref:Nudix hydrolase domain-containing protein n=1 Tax=Planococcus antarcticus DSM 14505 TaxID=1185653 RepID=A0ABM6D6H4_9BACL|nr:NUDIX domain-containing protein [Planococcus antarcticus]ANU10993.1 hypothetical protein BBH88_12085 [Planococcus antarcticus DSM 14505]
MSLKTGTVRYLLLIQTGEGPFYWPLGGTIELWEPSANALKREFKEEIGADIQIVRSLNVLENIYALKEQTFHEITLIYEVEFEERHLLERDYFVVTGAGKKTTAKWVSLEELSLQETTLYPVVLLDLIKNMADTIKLK